jgi:hypothetical protein
MGMRGLYAQCRVGLHCAFSSCVLWIRAVDIGEPRMHLLARITLWLGGLGFLGFGLAFLIAPLETLGSVGIVLGGDLAATELRAFYGGLEVALGLLLIAADLGGARRHGLILCFASYGGIGAARLLGIALAGSATPFLWFALATESVLALLSALALRATP